MLRLDVSRISSFWKIVLNEKTNFYNTGGVFCDTLCRVSSVAGDNIISKHTNIKFLYISTFIDLVLFMTN